jgi:Zn-dependent peptidase ImmA (M78 family)
MTYESDEDFEQLATTLRVAIGVDDQVNLDVIEFLRRMKRQGYISDYVRVPDVAMLDAEAKFKPDERKIYIRESVWAAAEKGIDRPRFTIIHECAHAALDHQFERKRSLFGHAITEMRVASIRRDEKQANKLAACIIAPFHRSDFSLTTTAGRLMERFGLSSPAASIRIEEMAGIFRRLNKLPRPLPPGVVDFLAARRRDGHTVTSLPSAEVAAMQVRQPVYTGDACPICGGFKMIRVGTMMKCDLESCGAVTGDD